MSSAWNVDALSKQVSLPPQLTAYSRACSRKARQWWVAAGRPWQERTLWPVRCADKWAEPSESRQGARGQTRSTQSPPTWGRKAIVLYFRKEQLNRKKTRELQTHYITGYIVTLKSWYSAKTKKTWSRKRKEPGDGEEQEVGGSALLVQLLPLLTNHGTDTASAVLHIQLNKRNKSNDYDTTLMPSSSHSIALQCHSTKLWAWIYSKNLETVYPYTSVKQRHGEW